MSEQGSVTQFIEQVKDGSSLAALELWQRYHHRLVGMARKKLSDAPRQVVDKEDVVVLAFDAFLRAMWQGRYPNLKDRDDLWRLLARSSNERALSQVERTHKTSRAARTP